MPVSRAALTGALVAALALALVPAWVLPNVGGRLFVSVRIVASHDARANASAAGSTAPSTVVGPGSVVALQVGDAYPLAVVLSYRGPAYQVALVRRLPDGRRLPVWTATPDDPAAEEGSDSPGGGGATDLTIAIPPGTSTHVLSDAGGTMMLPNSLPAGTYELDARAYGIPAAPVQLVVSAALATR